MIWWTTAKPSPVPVVAPDTPAEDFALRLSPLTRDDLAQEAKAWLALLKAKTQEVVEMRLALKGASAAETDRITEALVPVTAQRREISGKLSTIVDDWEAKGGDPKEILPYRQYIQTVYTEQIKASGLTMIWTQFMKWLFSAEGGLAL